MKKAIFCLYAIFLVCLIIFSYAFVDPNLSYLHNVYSGFAHGHRAITTFIYVIFILLFSIFYILFSWWVNTKKLSMSEIRWLIIVTAVFLLFSYPAMLSYDIFNYIATAKALYFYHENPYIIMPIEFLGDPLLSFTHAANKIALYGPAWLGLSSIPFFLGFGNFLLMLYGFKALVSLFYLAQVALIWKMTKDFFPVILFALNPLVIIETLLSGHNDIVMMFFALFSFYMLKHKKIWFGILFLITSILIKYAAIFLVPVFAFVAWKILLKNKIDWKRVFNASTLLMFGAFLLSPLREEIYPWYAIWFLLFALLNPARRFILYGSLAFSFSLLFRYTPYMLLGTYLDPTPILKNIISFVPLFLFSIYYVLKKKI